ncbi:hypothetical protein [Gallaecimonas pentaromativorans]|uniref:Uncharacterized protein n=1 Tax=Gallaecimonas pentaromativorans TaxID=584787 RepID=A0A3N1PEF3_9GAMM|nr:hypothetical protein [Gallaecimonas pentaromativorans]MED5526319.1 hypothetical protein [Pseudomonadota bacterium]ROQ30354.1 hypothetical protein EDC28_10140 [Gallaecimonas pentaromativorans]
MKKALFALLLTQASLLPQPVLAADASANLGQCLIDSLNGRERKQLAQWIFFAMSKHPDIQQYAKVSAQDITLSNKSTGALITRLLTEDCPAQASAALKTSPTAWQGAFQMVGQVAMQELMTNPDVSAAVTGYTQYLDMDKIRELGAK